MVAINYHDAKSRLLDSNCRLMWAFATALCGLCILSPFTVRNINGIWFQIFVSLVADLSSEPPCTQGVAGSIPTRGTEHFLLSHNLLNLKTSIKLWTSTFINPGYWTPIIGLYVRLQLPHIMVFVPSYPSQ